jgi:putative cardiolipin synthase
VRALTNSAASNDVLAAHAGYVNTRKPLLQAGLELYELRPDSNMKREWSLLAGKSRAALHAKSPVFDRRSVFIGSFNLDPRSTALNTEIGVMIDSPEIVGQVGELMDEGVSSAAPFTSRWTRTMTWCGPLRTTRQKWSTTKIRRPASGTGSLWAS